MINAYILNWKIDTHHDFQHFIAGYIYLVKLYMIFIASF